MLGAIAFADMLCEGARPPIGRRSIYRDRFDATGAVPGLGYAAFALAMVTVRLSGNRLLRRFRPPRLLPVLAAAATAGFAAGLAIGRPAAAIAGFFFLGIGLASVIPAVFSAAGRIAGLHPGTAVATVAACGWAGFVCGPPLIGHLASLASCLLALGLLPFLTAFVARRHPYVPCMAVTLRKDQKPPPARSRRHAMTCAGSWPKDYGEVISDPMPAETILELADLSAGQQANEFRRPVLEIPPAL